MPLHSTFLRISPEIWSHASLLFGCNEGLAFLDVTRQLSNRRLQQTLLILRQGAHRECLLGAFGAEFDWHSEIIHTKSLSNLRASCDAREVNVCRLNDTSFTLGRLHYCLCETGVDVSANSSFQGYLTHRNPAYAIHVVAEPAPALALTISSPPN